MTSRPERLTLLVTGLIHVTLLWGCISTSKALRDEPSTVRKQVEPVTKISTPPTTDAWYSLQFVNADCAFLATPKGLWKSLDGGKNWQMVYHAEEYEQTITKIYFLDLTFGWMETHGGWYKSEDAGQTWMSFANPLSSSGRLRDVKFISRDTGYIAGAVGRTPSREELGPGGVPEVPRYLYDDTTKKVLAPSIYRTDDAGKTWRPQVLPGNLGSIEQLSFIDSDHGIALSDHDTIRTQNGGATWSKVNDPRTCLNDEARGLYEGRPSSAYILNLSFAWIAFDDGRILRTANGGATWVEIQPCDQSRPVVLHFSSENRGHGLGSDGLLYETTDGGKQWAKIGTDKYDSLSFLGQQHVWLVSERGVFSINDDK